MPTNLIDSELPLTKEELEKLWQGTRTRCGVADDVVSVRLVDKEEIQKLNREYRGKDAPTNVLTFSYPAASADEVSEHDVALCLPVARVEAADRGFELKEYVALLVVHAFLHVGGMDHERSVQEEAATMEAEKQILKECGFREAHLLVV